MRTTPIHVHCGHCHEDFDEQAVNILDVEAIRARHYKVVLDSINGAGVEAGKMLLDRLGCELVHINNKLDGDFTHEPEPIAKNLTGLCDAVRQHGADIGFAQDPDADRLVVVDEATRLGVRPGEISVALDPSLIASSSPRCTFSSLSASSADVDSSRISTSGLRTSARASARRWRCPPESRRSVTRVS